MASSATLLREIDVMERIQRELAILSERTDDGRKRDLVKLRRLLSEQVGRISVEGEQVFGGSVDPRFALEFRSHLSGMRNAVALHQANWPAVRLDEADDEYKRSVLAARSASVAFLSWTRRALGDLSRRDKT